MSIDASSSTPDASPRRRRQSADLLGQHSGRRSPSQTAADSFVADDDGKKTGRRAQLRGNTRPRRAGYLMHREDERQRRRFWQSIDRVDALSKDSLRFASHTLACATVSRSHAPQPTTTRRESATGQTHGRTRSVCPRSGSAELRRLRSVAADGPVGMTGRVQRQLIAPGCAAR